MPFLDVGKAGALKDAVRELKNSDAFFVFTKREGKWGMRCFLDEWQGHR